MHSLISSLYLNGQKLFIKEKMQLERFAKKKMIYFQTPTITQKFKCIKDVIGWGFHLFFFHFFKTYGLVKRNRISLDRRMSDYMTHILPKFFCRKISYTDE